MGACVYTLRLMVISIINQKGGVGKTTTTVNLGAALAEAGHRVLLLDLDPQRSLSHYSALASERLAMEEATPEEIREVLVQAGPARFDYALLDCPPTLGMESAASLKVADLALLPLQAAMPAWVGLAGTLQTVRAARERINPALRLKLFMTLFDTRTRHCAEVEALTRKAFGSDVLETVVRRSIVFDDAAAAGTSVLEYAPHSSGAQSYRLIADEVAKLGS